MARDEQARLVELARSGDADAARSLWRQAQRGDDPDLAWLAACQLGTAQQASLLARLWEQSELEALRRLAQQAGCVLGTEAVRSIDAAIGRLRGRRHRDPLTRVQVCYALLGALRFSASSAAEQQHPRGLRCAVEALREASCVRLRLSLSRPNGRSFRDELGREEVVVALVSTGDGLDRLDDEKSTPA